MKIPNIADRESTSAPTLAEATAAFDEIDAALKAFELCPGEITLPLVSGYGATVGSIATLLREAAGSVEAKKGMALLVGDGDLDTVAANLRECAARLEALGILARDALAAAENDLSKAIRSVKAIQSAIPKLASVGKTFANSVKRYQKARREYMSAVRAVTQSNVNFGGDFSEEILGPDLAK